MRMVTFVKQIRFPRKKMDELDDCWSRQRIHIELLVDSSDDESLKAINYVERGIMALQEVYLDE